MDTPDYDAIFDTISKQCGTPRAWLRMGDDGTVQFAGVDEATPYADLKCVLDGLRAHDIPMKMGYIVQPPQP